MGAFTEVRASRFDRRSIVLAAGLVATALAATLLLLLATRTWGLGVSYDSVVYVQASHDLSSIPLPQPLDDGGKALYWWAPVYPLALKLVGGGYGDARILNALLLLVGTLLIGALAWRSIGRRAAIVATALYAFSPAVFAVHLNLLAEPLFLIFATGCIGLVTDRKPAVAGLAAAAATLTRYAGLPLIVVGVVVFRGRDRIRFLVAALVPYVLWLIRNQVTAGEATGRQVRWHPVDWGVVRRATSTAAHLLVTDGRLPSVSLPAIGAGRILQGIAVVALVIALVRTDWRKVPGLVIIGGIYAALYIGFLVVTVSLLDAATPVDARLLVPLAPSVVFALAWLTNRTPPAAVAIVVVFAIATAQVARTASFYGLDYSGRIWSVARIDERTLPPGPLRSNWPAAVAYFTGRSTGRLPQAVDGHTLDANSQFDRQLRELAASTRRGETSLVLLDNAFLQIPSKGKPLSETPLLDGLCRKISSVVTICQARR